MKSGAKTGYLSGGTETSGIKMLLLVIASIFFSVVVIASTVFFSWELAVVEAAVLLVVVYFKEVKNRILSWFDIFRKRPAEIILFGFFLGVVMAVVTTAWIRYLAAFAFFIIALALYKGYKRERDEERLAGKIMMEKEQDGYD